MPARISYQADVDKRNVTMLQGDSRGDVVPARFRRLSALIAICLPLWAGGATTLAAAENVAADYGCSMPIKVAAFEFGPWYQRGSGINVDLFGVISQKTGCRFDFVEIPRRQAWASMANREIDITPNSIETEDRRKLARFVTFLSIRNLMVVRADGEAAINSLDAFVADRKGDIGLIAGFLYGSYFDLRLKSLQGDDRVLLVDDPRLLVDMLRRNEVEAILLPSGHYFSYIPEKERQTLFRVLDTSPAMPQPSGFALSREKFSALQVDNWLRLMEAMFTDGSLEKLIERHLPRRVAATLTTR